MKRTRVKICGITSVADAVMAASFGCDAIGLVFYKKSPRCVSLETAKAICAALPPFVTTTALFVDASEQEINTVLEQVPLDLLQFHGNETAGFCASFSKPYIKAISIRDSSSADGARPDISNIDSKIEKQQQSLLENIALYHSARGFLIDHFDPVKVGGTGKVFDWKIIPDKLGGKIILAGGLHADNVRQAILEVRPYAVDVSSGVEKLLDVKMEDKKMNNRETLKGQKEKQRLADFFEAVKKADLLI